MPITVQDLIKQAMLGGSGGSSGSGGGGWPEAPDDGKTRLYITLNEGRTSPMLGVGVDGTVTVDWGDGTEPDVLTGVNTGTSGAKWTPSHEYPAPGNYVITLSVDGLISLIGTNTADNGPYILRHSASNDVRNNAYTNAIVNVEIGANTTLTNAYTFYRCSSLSSVSLSNYQGTNLMSGMFYCCYRITNIAIPANVSRINALTFYQCCGMRIYDFTSHTAVPTLAATDAFTGIPADCEIRVPAALYDEWIAATNWSTYADYIKAY